MFITKKKHLQELDKKNAEIKKLEEMVNILVLSEVGLKEKNINQEDKIRFLNKRIENREEQIEIMNQYLCKTTKQSEEEISHLEQKVECRDFDILNLRESLTNCNEFIKQFELNSLKRLQVIVDKSNKKRLKKKRQKIYDDRLIEVLKNNFGGENA